MAKAATKKTYSKSTSLAEYIAHQIEISDMSQREIAAALGYENANVISLFKKGLTKVPIPKVPALADALGLDRLHLLRLAMTEYAPETWAAIQEVLDRREKVTDNEYEIIEVIREVVGGTDPKLNSEAKEQFKAAAKMLKL